MPGSSSKKIVALFSIIVPRSKSGSGFIVNATTLWLSNSSVTQSGRFIFTIVSSLSSGRLSGTGDTTDMEFYIYGYQLENGAYKTSYIPTTTAPATRTADVCNNAGTSATFNSTEGVLFAEIAALADDSTQRFISLGDGTSNNKAT